LKIEEKIKDFEEARKAPPGVLLPYQQAWVADKSPVKIFEKSRRIGISWAEASDDALYAASASGDNVWYIGYNKDMALEFINDCGNWAKAYDLAASEMEEIVFNDGDKDIKAFKIDFASGHRITALSSRPTNLRGKQGRVVLDESAFHDDLPALIKAAMALLIWGGDVRIISTHNGDDNDFNGLVQDTRAGRKPYRLHRCDFDEALRQGLYKRICEVLKREWSEEAEKAWRQEVIDFYGDDADEELFVIPSQGSGTYLSRALIEACMTPKIPVICYEQKSSFAELPEHIRRAEVNDWCNETLKPLLDKVDKRRVSYFGEDFGRLGDLTIIMPLLEQQNATFRAPFILELWNMPFEQQKQILFYIVDRLPHFSGGALDARGNGQYLAEVAMQRYGANRIAQVMSSEAWYRDYMPKYKAMFEDKTILLPKDADIIQDHRAIKVIRGVARVPDVRTKGKDNKKRHGDSAIAGAMATYAIYEMAGNADAPVVMSAGSRNMASEMTEYFGRTNYAAY
jgi:phage FluMu gp28-like protein